MAEVLDILCDESGELLCVNGDMVIGDATLQHQADLLVACEGEYKQSLTTGVGMSGFLNDEDKRPLLRKIRGQFRADGMQVNNLQFSGNLLINAAY